ESSESKDQEFSNEEPSNEEASNEETSNEEAGVDEDNEMALGMIDPSTASYSMKEEKDEQLLSQLAEINAKFDLILKHLKNEQLKNRNPEENSEENSMLLLEKPSENLFENLFGDFRRSFLASALVGPPSRELKSSRTRFSRQNFNRANSENENSSLVSGDPSSTSTANSTTKEALGERAGNLSNLAVVSSLSNTFNSTAAAPTGLDPQIADQTEALAGEIFDPRENTAMAANSRNAESNDKDSKQSHSQVFALVSLIKTSLDKALNRIPEIAGFMDLINSSPLKLANRGNSSKLGPSDRASHESGTSENTPQAAEPKLLATLNERRKLLAEPESVS
ncbi:MAG: hypothetical protein ACO3LE_11385, partial [Bdellovibrionota bacterium]